MFSQFFFISRVMELWDCRYLLCFIVIRFFDTDLSVIIVIVTIAYVIRTITLKTSKMNDIIYHPTDFDTDMAKVPYQL